MHAAGVHRRRHERAEASIIGDGGVKEGDGAFLLLVGEHLAEGDTRVVVDGDVDKFPSDDEPLAEDDGELGFCLGPLAGWTLPLLSGGVEHEV